MMEDFFCDLSPTLFENIKEHVDDDYVLLVMPRREFILNEQHAELAAALTIHFGLLVFQFGREQLQVLCDEYKWTLEHIATWRYGGLEPDAAMLRITQKHINNARNRNYSRAYDAVLCFFFFHFMGFETEHAHVAKQFGRHVRALLGDDVFIDIARLCDLNLHEVLEHGSVNA